MARKREISSNEVIILGALVFFVSVITTLVALSPGWITGLASTQYGRVNVTVTATTDIMLIPNNITFAGVPGGTNDTVSATGAPPPIGIQNNGSVEVDVNVTFNKNYTNFWAGTGATEFYFQYNCSNHSASAGLSARNGTCACYNSTPYNVSVGLDGAWCNITLGISESVPLVRNLNYSDASDTVVFNMKIIVPNDEGAAKRNATITFSAIQATK